MGAMQDNALEPTILERNHILQEIFENIADFASHFNLVDYDALRSEVLKPVLDGVFDPEVQIRGFLRAFKNTVTFRSALGQLNDAQLEEQITRFIEGEKAGDVVDKHGFEVTSHPSPPVRHHFQLLDELKKLFADVAELRAAVHDVFHPKHKNLKGLPILWENEEKSKAIEVAVSNVKFENWGQTVVNTPRYTFVPTTIFGVQSIVRYAAESGYRVRCGGYRHSWSSIFSQDNEILISLLDLEQVTTLPDPMSICGGDFIPGAPNELKTIELKETTGEGKRLCRIGVAVTNEDFRRWAVHNDAWTLPVDVILVEVTIGGVHGPICHGAGHRHKTIGDYVRKIEYVDCKGNANHIDDPYLIKAAAGSFGLLGVVTHITIELDAMSYAVMQPRKVDIGLAVPPLHQADIPQALRSNWFNSEDAPKLLANAKEDFERRALNDYYSEWFWFTYQRKAWVNTWDVTSDPEGAQEYPNEAQTFLQWIEGWLGGFITSVPLFNAIPGYWQAQLLATLGMAALPPTFGENDTPTIKTALPNALHFRRGIQNMRVRDLEFQIPIPPRKEDTTKPDLSIVQRAWWDVIKLVYQEAENENDPSSPMRLTLELRIMGGSDLIMAPQKGNKWGTASIEVLTIPDSVTDEEWHDFIQKVADIWMSYGESINVRPHWAKEWETLRLRGLDAREYLKKVAYREQIPEFRNALQKIGAPHGWGIDDLRSRFSNELWDKIIFE